MSTLARTFFDNSRRTPGRIAVRCEGTAITYADLARRVARWSAAMTGRGVRRGDAVGVVLPNSLDFVALMLVAADLGVALAPMPPALGAPALMRAFMACDVRHVVATQDQIASLQATAEAGAVGGLWLAVDLDQATADCIGLAALLDEASADAMPALAGQDDDALILTMTSGSTGAPKPIVLTQRTKINRAMAAVEMYGVTVGDVTLAATPLYHSLAERLVLIPLLTGGSSVVMARFSAREWLTTVRTHAVTFTIAVSSQLAQIATQMGEDTPVDSLRCVVSSSALLDTPTKAALLAKLHCDFHECYGTSEIAIATNLDPEGARTRLNSVGRAAVGVDVRILTDRDEIAGPGVVGEIVCRTPMLFGGYFKQPELTAAAMWGDYFRTGDLGRLDEEGFLYFVGRKKEIIITGAINVYPGDVEAALKDYPGLKEAAAFAVPDDRLGEVVGLALVTEDPAGFDLRKLRFHCAAALADFQQPRKFLMLDALPRNAMGKLTRHVLLSRYMAATTDK